MADQTDMRQNKITGEWTIYSAVRRQRPHDTPEAAGSVDVAPQLPAYDANCPFCPGNEHLLPPIIMELPAPDGRPWMTRVVYNKYPVLRAGGGAWQTDFGVYQAMAGRGRHEVLIETGRHNDDLALMPAPEVRAVIETYWLRYRDKAPGEAATILFRNHGARAGASLLHPHSQLIATHIVPPRIQAGEEAARRYFDEQGRCGFCDILKLETADGRRVVAENDSFAAFVPFSATAPFETWIVPYRHAADFGASSETERADLAAILADVLRRLREVAGNPDYNYMLRTASTSSVGTPFLHWHVQIRPRLSTAAGFEIESGMYINASLPEDDAKALKEGR